MNRKSNVLYVVTLGLLFGAAGYIMAESSWWERLRSKKTPQVLEEKPAVAPLEVHPNVANLQDSFAQVAELVKPAVVNISAVQITTAQEDPHEFYFGDPNEFFYRYFGQRAPSRRPQEYRSEGTGSGVIIDPDGYILTNNHVVQEADQLTVTLSNGKSYKGKVVGTDPRSDLAVIRITAKQPFSYVPLGDSSSMRIGDWVVAIGSPFGLEQTVTAGIVSAIRQSLNIEGKTFANLIQTDAAINRGNSGGPLVNLKGQVIGINTAIYAPTGVFSGIGFAIPVNNAKRILKELIEKGFVERSWMGVEIAAIDEVMAEQFGLDSTQGALVNLIMPDSPAEKAGLKRGDVVLEFDGKKIETVGQLQDIVSATPPKKTVEIRVLREGKKRVLKLVTALMPDTSNEQGRSRGEDSDDQKPGPKNMEWLGAQFGDRSGQVVALRVPAESFAAEAGLQEGDTINAINRYAIHSMADLKKASESVKPKDGVVFDITRNGKSFYLSYKALQ